VDRLTTAVEGIGADLRDIRSEIHGQVAGLKIEIHDQVAGLRSELHNHVQQQETRFNAVEGRIDALSSGVGLLTGPSTEPFRRARMRLDQELGCLHPAMGDETDNGSADG
jgi:hypothetical protein